MSSRPPLTLRHLIKRALALAGPLSLLLLTAAGWGLGQRWGPAAGVPAAADAAAADPPGIKPDTPPTPWAEVTAPLTAPDAAARQPVLLASPQTSTFDARPWPLDGVLALGGPITLASLQEPAMLPMARAEQLLLQRNSDPLVALPAALREPLRRQLQRKGQEIATARVVAMPLPDLRDPVAVPLLRRADGEVDVYADRLTPAMTQALEQWLINLEPLPPGQVQPLLLRLRPWPAAGPDPQD